jgi:hypothetical protein
VTYLVAVAVWLLVSLAFSGGWLWGHSKGWDKGYAAGCNDRQEWP